MAAKIAAARQARRHLFIIARTDAAASEGIDGSVARAKLFLEAGADAIFPEALTTAEMFRDVRRRAADVPLLANMTEFGRTPFFTAAEFQAMGYKMVIWPVSSLRVANKAQAEALRGDQRATAARRTWSTACKPGPNCTRRSAITTTRRWTPSIVTDRRSRRPCRNDGATSPA